MPFLTFRIIERDGELGIFLSRWDYRDKDPVMWNGAVFTSLIHLSIICFFPPKTESLRLYFQ
jgi:hypothetical protein